MRAFNVIRYAAYTAKTFCIRKGNTGKSCTESSRINSQNEVPPEIIVIIFTVEVFRYFPGVLILYERIHDTNIRRQPLACIMQMIIVFNYLIRESHFLKINFATIFTTRASAICRNQLANRINSYILAV